MLTFVGIICALQHLQLCNSHQGAVWLWIYMYILKSVSQVRAPNAKCIAQEHREDLSLPQKSSGVGSTESHRCNWNIFIFWWGQAVCNAAQVRGEKIALFPSDLQLQFHKEESLWREMCWEASIGNTWVFTQDKWILQKQMMLLYYRNR